MYRHIQLHQENSLGKDYVIGDVHGSVSTLKACLDRLGFDRRVDRLFSVGDLVDRGLNSFESLKLLEEPWFFAVRGNHEDMMLSFLHRYDSDYHAPSDFIYNGGNWINQLNPEQFEYLSKKIAPLLDQLPYVRSVTNSNASQAIFHVAHAELIRPGRRSFSQSAVENGFSFLTDEEILGWAKDFRCVPQDLDIKLFEACCTWGRRLIGQTEARESLDLSALGVFPSKGFVSNDAFAKELSLVFVGHTIVDQPILSHSHFFIDSGAWRRIHSDECVFFIADAMACAERFQAFKEKRGLKSKNC